ncbi:hypothetical protein Csa_006444 [Cucumis sativus]|uniref:Uncharacterized protein n=1 Tax=Cucumis sativus TaxID=3659 RepID=A0A0A0LKE7_CUCSA|nr:hypothetical protein Csa_006444 [Cucumis sativus]
MTSEEVAIGEKLDLEHEVTKIGNKYEQKKHVVELQGVEGGQQIALLRCLGKNHVVVKLIALWWSLG